MADLDPLIRYRKYIVDEKQRVLSQLYEQAERLEGEKQNLLDEMRRETELAKQSNDPETAGFLGRYLHNARYKIDDITAKQRALEAKISVAQEDVRAAFAELKKIQITQRNREDEERAEEKAKEDKMYDDIALDGYRRNLEEE